MTSTRRTAPIVGVLFLVQTLAFITAEQILTGVSPIGALLSANEMTQVGRRP